MRVLNVSEIKEVNGGNPLLIMLAVQGVRFGAKKAAPYVKMGVIALVGVICGNVGTDHGRS